MIFNPRSTRVALIVLVAYNVKLDGFFFNAFIAVVAW